MSTNREQIQPDGAIAFLPKTSEASLVQQILQADTIEEMARAFGFVYSESSRFVPDEDEAITGETANEYFALATADPRRYDPFCARLHNISCQVAKADDIKVIVDVGCGTGVLSSQLARLFPAAKVYGLDLSKDMIELASAYRLSLSDDLRNRLAFQQGSIYNVESLMETWGVENADITISRHVFHRLIDPELALRKVLQITKPTGLLYVATFVGDLKSEAIRVRLLENMKRRIIGPSGEPYVNFAKCYLSAALRAPIEARYREVFVNARNEFKPRSSSIEFSSHECDCEITICR